MYTKVILTSLLWGETSSDGEDCFGLPTVWLWGADAFCAWFGMVFTSAFKK